VLVTILNQKLNGAAEADASSSTYKGQTMRKLVFAIVAITAMMFAGQTEATTLAGAVANSLPEGH
jgi:hypothetical protein